MLESLGDIPWNSIASAYGHCGDVPRVIRGLCSPIREQCERAASWLQDNAFHQGTHYEVNAHIVPFLLEVVSEEHFVHRDVTAATLMQWFCDGNAVLPLPPESPAAWKERLEHGSIVPNHWREYFQRSCAVLWEHRQRLETMLLNDTRVRHRCDAANLLGAMVAEGHSEGGDWFERRPASWYSEAEERRLLDLLARCAMHDPSGCVRMVCVLNLGVNRDAEGNALRLAEIGKSDKESVRHATSLAHWALLDVKPTAQMAIDLARGWIEIALATSDVREQTESDFVSQQLFRYTARWLTAAPHSRKDLEYELIRVLKKGALRQRCLAAAALGSFPTENEAVPDALVQTVESEEPALAMWAADALRRQNYDCDWAKAARRALLSSRTANVSLAISCLAWSLPASTFVHDPLDEKRHLFAEFDEEFEEDEYRESHLPDILPWLGEAIAKSDEDTKLQVAAVLKSVRNDWEELIPTVAGWFSSASLRDAAARLIASIPYPDDDAWWWPEILKPMLAAIRTPIDERQSLLLMLCQQKHEPEYVQRTILNLLRTDPDPTFRQHCAEYVRLIPNARSAVPEILSMLDGSGPVIAEAVHYFRSRYDTVAPLDLYSDADTAKVLLAAFDEDRKTEDGQSLRPWLVGPLCRMKIEQPRIASSLQRELEAGWPQKPSEIHCLEELADWIVELPFTSELIEDVRLRAAREVETPSGRERAARALFSSSEIDSITDRIRSLFEDGDAFAVRGLLKGLLDISRPRVEFYSEVLALLRHDDEQVRRFAFAFLKLPDVDGATTESLVLGELRAPLAGTRQAAAMWFYQRELAGSASQVKAALVTAARSHQETRLWAWRTLSQLGAQEEAIEVAGLTLLGERSHHFQICDWLEEQGAVAMPALLRGLEAELPEVRFRSGLALFSLDRSRRPQVLQVAQQLKCHPLGPVRRLGEELEAEVS